MITLPWEWRKRALAAEEVRRLLDDANQQKGAIIEEIEYQQKRERAQLAEALMENLRLRDQIHTMSHR